MTRPQRLACPWCDFFIWVVTRGSEAGVEAATAMQSHVCTHGHTWREYVKATR